MSDESGQDPLRKGRALSDATASNGSASPPPSSPRPLSRDDSHLNVSSFANTSIESLNSSVVQQQQQKGPDPVHEAPPPQQQQQPQQPPPQLNKSKELKDNLAIRFMEDEFEELLPKELWWRLGLSGGSTVSTVLKKKVSVNGLTRVFGARRNNSKPGNGGFGKQKVAADDGVDQRAAADVGDCDVEDEKQQNPEDSLRPQGAASLPPLIPIVYSPDYNITWLGLQKLHPFDSTKYRNVVHNLKILRPRAKLGAAAFEEAQLVSPSGPMDMKYLSQIHTQRYLESLQNKSEVARITEVAPVAMLSISVIESRLLKPFKTMCTGSVLAARVALQQGVGVNLGGGFHHCSNDSGGGFCAYADITLIIWFLRRYVNFGRLNQDGSRNRGRIAIIDLDAHQGNGHARDKTTVLQRDRPADVLIMDVYNRDIYPQDHDAKAGIDIDCPIESYTQDATYLKEVAYGLRRLREESFARWNQLPDLVIYNAGTDVLENDSLGCLSVSEKGVKDRDRMVFEACRNGNWFQLDEAALAPSGRLDDPVPVCMLLSGGYQKSNARVIAESLHELQQLHPEYGLLAPPSRHRGATFNTGTGAAGKMAAAPARQKLSESTGVFERAAQALPVVDPDEAPGPALFQSAGGRPSVRALGRQPVDMPTLTGAEPEDEVDTLIEIFDTWSQKW